MNYTKTAFNKLREEEVKTIANEYDLDFLLRQKKILETELKKVNDLISEAEKLGIKISNEIYE